MHRIIDYNFLKFLYNFELKQYTLLGTIFIYYLEYVFVFKNHPYITLVPRNILLPIKLYLEIIIRSVNDLYKYPIIFEPNKFHSHEIQKYYDT